MTNNHSFCFQLFWSGNFPWTVISETQNLSNMLHYSVVLFSSEEAEGRVSCRRSWSNCSRSLCRNALVQKRNGLRLFPNARSCRPGSSAPNSGGRCGPKIRRWIAGYVYGKLTPGQFVQGCQFVSKHYLHCQFCLCGFYMLILFGCSERLSVSCKT
jgi:hypothetical protein